MDETYSQELAEHLRGVAFTRLEELKGTPEIQRSLAAATEQTDAAQSVSLMIKQLVCQVG